jgi:alkylhydroperoxidase/carboxymuconolactone decarboxylase family protein YurZ
MKSYNEVIIVLLISCISFQLEAQTLDKQQQSIATIAALTAKGDWDNLKTGLSQGLDNGLTINEIKEELVHLYAYTGFPKSISGLKVFITVLDERKINGIKDIQGKEASPIDDSNDKYERGKAVLEKLLQNPLPDTKPDYQQFSSEIDIFLKEHLFADIFERDILSYQQRELTTVSVLIALGNVEPMLRSHLKICIIQGFTKNQMEHLVETLKLYLKRKKIKSAKKIIKELE